MGLLDNLFGKKKNKASAAANARIFSELFYGNKTTIDDPENSDYIESGYRQNPTVQSIVDLVSKSASSVPWYVYKKNSDGTKDKVEIPLLQELLYSPNFKQSWGQVVRDAIAYKMLTGNAFIWGVGPEEGSINAGKPQAFWVLPSQHMQIWQEGAFGSISGYSVDFSNGGVGEMQMPPEEISHLSTFNPEYGEDGSLLFGQSPLRAAFTNVLTANEAVVSGQSYIKNQGPQTLLTAKHSPDTPSFDQEQAKQLKSQFRKQSQGSTNAGGVLITPMDFNVLQTGMSAADLALLEQYNMSKIDICNVFGVSPVLLNIGSGTYENVREAELSMWERVILPEMKELRDKLNKDFIYKFGKDICLDFDTTDISILNYRMIKQSEQLIKLQNHWTVDEIRQATGKKPLGGEYGSNPLPLQGTTGIGDPNQNED